MDEGHIMSSGRNLQCSTSFTDQLGHKSNEIASLKTSSSSQWPSVASQMYHHHHHMNHHAFQMHPHHPQAIRGVVGVAGAGGGYSPGTAASHGIHGINGTCHQIDQSTVTQANCGGGSAGASGAAGEGVTVTGAATAAAAAASTTTTGPGMAANGGNAVQSAISPSDSGPSNASLDNNDSNGTVFSGTPEHKGSIASRSEINYPVIGDHSSIYLSKQNRKLVRFVTVIAYIFFVSLAAIVLSFFYFFLWDPSMEGGVASDLPHDHFTGSVALMGPMMERTGRKKFGASHFPAAMNPSLSMHPDARNIPCPCDPSGHRVSTDGSNSEDGESGTGDTPNVIIPPPAAPTIGHLQQGIHVGVGSKSLSNSIPTAPSVYEMIARRPRVIPIHSTFVSDATSNHFDDRQVDSNSHPITLESTNGGEMQQNASTGATVQSH